MRKLRLRDKKPSLNCHPTFVEVCKPLSKVKDPEAEQDLWSVFCW